MSIREHLEHRICVKITRGQGSEKVIVYYKTDMKINFYSKWAWFFRYLAAKEQVEHPRQKVELAHINFQYTPPFAILEKRLKNMVTGRKAALTKYLNKVEHTKERYNAANLFGVETDPNWHKVLKNIRDLERNLKIAQEHLDALLDGSLEIPASTHECEMYRPHEA